MIKGEFYAGLDLGQAADPTALVVLERKVAPKTKTETVWMDTILGRRSIQKTTQVENPADDEFHVIHIERWRQLSYDVLAGIVQQRLERLERCTLCLDYTGVGRPVYDRFVALGLRPIPISIHGGNAVNRDGLGWSVPKRDLAASVAVALQNKTLQVAQNLPDADILRGELKNFKVKISASGRDTYAAGGDWRENPHDDTVLALAVSLWYAQRHSKRASVVALPSSWT